MWEKIDCKGHRELFGMNEMFCILIVVVIMCLSKFIAFHTEKGRLLHADYTWIDVTVQWKQQQELKFNDGFWFKITKKNSLSAICQWLDKDLLSHQLYRMPDWKTGCSPFSTFVSDWTVENTITEWQKL